MRLTDDEKLLEQVTVEQFRQNLVLLQAKEIEMPRVWVLELCDTIEARQGEISALEACCEKLKKQNMRIIKENMGMRESLKQAREALKAAWTESNEPWEEAYEKGMEAIAAIDKIGGMENE